MLDSAGADVKPIVLDRISKRFANGFLALEDFSLTLRPGEFVSLIGPSGCGKSTVLSLVAGLSGPSAGNIAWPDGGRDQIGFVFQEPTLMPWATIRDNVALPLSLAGKTASVDDSLAKVGLATFADSYPRQLSGGMKMRASIARAMAMRPSLLLLDEPFAALDEITRFDLIEQLLALWQEQRFSVLFVTHSITESVFMSQRVVVMAPRPGRVTAEIVIDEPSPRRPEFRSQPSYAAWCGQLLEALRDAKAATP
jgi:NitT/TauT family transport system ATP-binding protein